MSAETNLLFGIIALQMDFVSREDLIAATSKWIQDKDLSMRELLMASAAIDEEEAELLSALIEKHLARHDNDVEKSLVALSTVHGLAEELRELGDAEIEATLTHVSTQPDATIADASPAGGVGGPRFRVIRSHARGGLGEIFLAHDEELHREVALKEIQADKSGSVDNRVRFVQEAEITGRLEHPGIVPVYGLGHHADGRPFYAMRFIRGDSLKSAIASHHDATLSSRERHVQLRKLLGRFVDICQAVEYAHSRGILHRDLKPGNIMLGKYGETLVVDWGLAKSVQKQESNATELRSEPTLQPQSGQGSTATQVGSAVGTPAYMSPEQAAGNLEELGPPTDVYGLGATLYCLLTGRSPFAQSKVSEVVEHVIAGKFKRPRAVNPTVPGPLEAICLRAMARLPEDRYGKPAELANEIEHWLADEPVDSYRDSVTERLWRWSRKHRTAVSSAVAAMVVFGVGLVWGMMVLVETNRQVLSERNAARQSEALALHSLGLMHATAKKHDPAIEKLREAVRAWRQLVDASQVPSVSESHSEYERGLADSLTALARSLKGAKQRDAARIAMDEALEIRTAQWKQNRQSTRKIAALAAAYVAMGNLRAGSPQALEERVKWYTNAVEMVERIDATAQVEPENRTVVIQAYERRAVVYGELKNHTAAIADWQRILHLMTCPERKGNRLEYAMRLIQAGRVDDGYKETALIRRGKCDGSELLFVAINCAAAYVKISSGTKAKVSADTCQKACLDAVALAMKNEALAKGSVKNNVMMLKFAAAAPPFIVLGKVPGFVELVKRLEK